MSLAVLNLSEEDGCLFHDFLCMHLMGEGGGPASHRWYPLTRKLTFFCCLFIPNTVAEDRELFQLSAAVTLGRSSSQSVLVKEDIYPSLCPQEPVLAQSISDRVNMSLVMALNLLFSPILLICISLGKNK